MIGPGKYDKETTRVRLATKAVGVVLIVFEGERGTGFSVQAPAEITALLPEILRNVANDIEAEMDPDRN